MISWWLPSTDPLEEGEAVGGEERREEGRRREGGGRGKQVSNNSSTLESYRLTWCQARLVEMLASAWAACGLWSVGRGITMRRERNRIIEEDNK